MHRSRLSTILIDTPEADYHRASAFWSAALGVPATDVPDEPQFTSLPGVHPDYVVALQSIGANDVPRYHLDIETDDHEAEAARLIALGAVEVARWLDCHTLLVPGGQLICVIPVHSEPEVFDRLAHTWE